MELNVGKDQTCISELACAVFNKVGCEGLELHILSRSHMDSIDLDPRFIFGMWSNVY